MSRQIDGDLSAEESARLRELLSGGGAARTAFDQLRRVDDLVRRWGRRELDVDWDGFRRWVVQRATSQPAAEPAARIARAIRLFAPLAAAAAVVIVAVVYWSSRQIRQDGAPALEPVVQVAFHRTAGVTGPGHRTGEGEAPGTEAARPTAVVRFDRSAPVPHEAGPAEPMAFAGAVAVGAPRLGEPQETAPSPFF